MLGLGLNDPDVKVAELESDLESPEGIFETTPVDSYKSASHGHKSLCPLCKTFAAMVAARLYDDYVVKQSTSIVDHL